MKKDVSLHYQKTNKMNLIINKLSETEWRWLKKLISEENEIPLNEINESDIDDFITHLLLLEINNYKNK